MVRTGMGGLLAVLLLGAAAGCGGSAPECEGSEAGCSGSGSDDLEGRPPAASPSELERLRLHAVPLQPMSADAEAATRPVGPGAADLSAFSFVAEENHRYIFSCERLTLPSCWVRLLDDTGKLVAEVEGMGWIHNANVILDATAPRTYYVSVTASPSGTGTFRYRLRDYGADPEGEGIEGALPRAPSVTAFAGALQGPYDHDHFSFQAEAGDIIGFTCESASLGNNWGIALLSPDLSAVLTKEERSHRYVPSLAYELPAAGTYYAEVRQELYARLDEVVDYSCRLEALGRDDASDTEAGARPLALATPTPGRFEAQLDTDVFAVELEAGHYYRASCKPDAAHPGGSDSCKLMDFTAPGGAPLVKALFDFERAAQSELRSQVAGTHFVKVGGPPGVGYTLTLEDLGADPQGNTPETATLLAAPGTTVTGRREVAWDVDFFAFDAAPGIATRLVCSSGPDSSSFGVMLLDAAGAQVDSGGGYNVTQVAVGVKPAVAGRYYARVANSFGEGQPGFSCRLSTLADDHGDVPSAATALAGPGDVTLTLEAPGDLDLFRIDAPAGRVLALRCSSAVGQAPCALRILDAAGRVLSGPDVPVDHLSPAAAVLYLEASGATGSYTLSVSDEGPDAHGSTEATAGIIHPPIEARGYTQRGDVDVLRFDAEPRWHYRVRCWFEPSQERFPCIPSPVSGPVGVANTDDGYVVSVRSATPVYVTVPQSHGAYTVAVETYADDHGDLPGDATPLALGVEMYGSLEFLGDFDVFSIHLQAGVSRELHGGGCGPTVLAPDGTELPYDSMQTFTPTTTGTHFVSVGPTDFYCVGPYGLAVR